MRGEEFDAHIEKYAKRIARKIGIYGHSCIVLFGRTCCGKSCAIDKARHNTGLKIVESYGMYCIGSGISEAEILGHALKSATEYGPGFTVVLSVTSESVFKILKKYIPAIEMQRYKVQQ